MKPHRTCQYFGTVGIPLVYIHVALEVTVLVTWIGNRRQRSSLNDILNEYEPCCIYNESESVEYRKYMKGEATCLAKQITLWPQSIGSIWLIYPFVASSGTTYSG